jgi:hypothetical protein
VLLTHLLKALQGPDAFQAVSRSEMVAVRYAQAVKDYRWDPYCYSCQPITLPFKSLTCLLIERPLSSLLTKGSIERGRRIDLVSVQMQYFLLSLQRLSQYYARSSKVIYTGLVVITAVVVVVVSLVVTRPSSPLALFLPRRLRLYKHVKISSVD